MAPTRKRSRSKKQKRNQKTKRRVVGGGKVPTAASRSMTKRSMAHSAYGFSMAEDANRAAKAAARAAANRTASRAAANNAAPRAAANNAAPRAAASVPPANGAASNNSGNKQAVEELKQIAFSAKKDALRDVEELAVQAVEELKQMAFSRNEQAINALQELRDYSKNKNIIELASDAVWSLSTAKIGQVRKELQKEKKNRNKIRTATDQAKAAESKSAYNLEHRDTLTNGPSLEEQIKNEREGKSTDMLNCIFFMESIAEALRRGNGTMSYDDLSKDPYLTDILGRDAIVMKTNKDKLMPIYRLISQKDKHHGLRPVERIEHMKEDFWIGFIDDEFTKQRVIADIKSKMNEYNIAHK